MDIPNVTVIRPKSAGFKLPEFNLPKVNPKFLVGTTLALAVFSIMGAGLLYYQNRSQAPTKTSAATTTTITDNFSAALNSSVWTSSGTGIAVSGGVLNITTAGSSVSTNTITGDFNAEVDTPAGATGTLAAASTQITRPGAVRLRILRLGTNIQTMYNDGSGWQVLTSAPGSTSDTTVQLIGVGTFDNFSAQVNLLGAATPAPGTTAACSTQFTVLALVPTPTPTPSSSPTPTPVGASPTPTPTTTPRPTPTPTPIGTTPTPTPRPTPTPVPFCNTSCTGNTDCPSSMICYSGSCRNPSCVTSTSCTCTVTGPTPTPATNLTQAGSVAGTWTISIAGLVMVALGTLMLAF